MRIDGSYTLPSNPERVFEMLMDPHVIAACIPGCQSLTAEGERTYNMKLKVALAAISGDFAGKVTIEDPNPPVSYRLRIDSAGRIGFIRGHGDLTLAPSDGGGTLVTYEGEVHAGGTIAAVGQRLLDTTARMMLRRFFEQLTMRLEATSTASGASA